MVKKKPQASAMMGDLFTTTQRLSFATSSASAPFLYRAKCTISFVDRSFDANPARPDGPVYTCEAKVDGFSRNCSIIGIVPTAGVISEVTGTINLETPSRLNAASSIEVTIIVTKKRKVSQVGPA